MEYFENKSLNVLNEDKECQSNKQFELTEEMKEKLINIPQVIEFIEKLLKFIEKQKNKINKLIKKSKQKHKKDVEVQTDCDANNEENVEISSQGITKTLVDDIKDAAEQAMQNSGFVYEETSGMYYDYSTGYYYNAEYGLYYDGNSGTYLKYNQDTQSYEYHSQVTVENIGTQNKAKRKSKSLKKIKARKRKNEGKIVEEFEEGECSDSSSIDIISSDNADSDSSDVTTQWPPCMRIIVEDTSAPKLKIGSLHILTYEGGSIGREGDHAIIIPDINISKHHLNISFNKETNTFQALDIGSRNGTLLNGQRMSPSKQESEVFDIKHGSKIQLGSTILLCHVHDGHQTCGHCEPGLIEHIKKKSTVETKKVSKSENHKKELQNLKKKFGMSNFAENNSKLASGYTDRAKKRRETVGSQNPHEKTQSSSVEESIPSENIGFKLLSKMGWKEGESLGKEGQGILEPINLVSNEGTSGVGCINKVSININKKDLDKKNVWSKAQQRFDKLSEPQNDFDDTSQ